MKPVELYRFVQDGVITTLTSADRSSEYNAETYEPETMGRSRINSSGELSKANLEVTMSLNSSHAQGWMSMTSERSLVLTVFSKTDSGVTVIWKGRMSGITPQTSDIKFTFESIFTSLRRPGLRARYTRTCRHAVYFGACGLDKADYAVVGEATDVDGLVITVPSASGAPAGDYFTGMLEYEGVFRLVTAHAGTSIKLSRPIAALSAALAVGPVNVTLYPGCDRSRARCKARFNNLANNGSFPFQPPRNPFDGSSIV